MSGADISNWFVIFVTCGLSSFYLHGWASRFLAFRPVWRAVGLLLELVAVAFSLASTLGGVMLLQGVSTHIYPFEFVVLILVLALTAVDYLAGRMVTK